MLSETKVKGLLFDEWMGKVNAALLAKYGVTSDDLPDVDYWKWWNRGDDVKIAANRAARNAGATF